MTATPDPAGIRRDEPRLWENVPQRNKNFTGRDDVFAWLRGGNPRRGTQDEPLPRVLQGVFGVGKTAVAVEYAFRFRFDYEVVWWVPADQPALVRSSLAALASRLGLESARVSGIDDAAAAALDALRRGEPYGRWLLIFDNADQPEDLNEYILRGPGDVLITSRNHRWQSVVETMPLDVFARDESREFLARRIRMRLASYDAEALAEVLGDLPLALEQAGGVLAETGMPVREYLELLDQHVGNILAEGKPPDYPWSMTAGWKLSAATVRDRLPSALDLLRRCAFFAAAPIPQDVFPRSTKETGASPDSHLADPISLAQAVRELGMSGLARVDGRDIWVHRLIQALARYELGADETAEYRHSVHRMLAAALSADPGDTKLWPRYGELVPHVRSPVTGLVLCRDPMVRAGALKVLRYLCISGDLSGCRSLAEELIAQWTDEAGPDDPTVLDARRHLGNALRELGRYQEAREANEAALRHANELTGERSDLTLALRNAVGADLRACGDFAAARKLDEETRNLHAEVFGPADRLTLNAVASLAFDYELISDYDAARQLYLEAYRGLSQATWASPSDVLISWAGLARACGLGGSYAEARDIGVDLVEYGRQELGPEHYLTLRGMRDLSVALRREGTQPDSALSLAREVHKTFARRYKDNHPDTLAAATGLANALRVTDRAEQALRLAEDIAAGCQAVYGPDHPYWHGCAGNLALLCRLSGEPDKALSLDEKVLAKLDDILGRNHRYSLTVAANQASDLAAMGQTAEARALGEDTLARLRGLLGDSHPLTLGCAANLTLDLRADGVDDDAERLGKETMNRIVQTLGEGSPEAEIAAAGSRFDFDFDPVPA